MAAVARSPEEEEEAGGSGQELIQVAHVAGQVGRPEDAVRFLQEAANLLFESCPDVEFRASDRSLLAKSLKLVINPLRNTVRTLFSALGPGFAGEDKQQLLREYRKCKTAELKDMCEQVVNLIRDIFLPMAASAESRVFFNKLAADHARYLCEIPLSAPSQDELEDREAVVAQAEAFYQAALDEAQSDLPPTHPLRLSLILNFAIFLFEIKMDQERACEFARTAYDDAAAELGIDPADNPSARPEPLIHALGSKANGGNGRSTKALKSNESEGYSGNGPQNFGARTDTKNAANANGQAVQIPQPPPPAHLYASAVGPLDQNSEASSGATLRESEAARVLRILHASLRRWSAHPPDH